MNHVRICTLILVLSIVGNSYSSCPYEECKCSSDVIDCRKSDFDLQENTTINTGIIEAYFSGLEINFIGIETFICDNCTLEILDLSANDIESVPGRTFESLNSLTILKLRNNKISLLKNNSFKDLLDLTILDLGFNKIEHLPSDLLNELTNLSHLDLKYNEIEYIPDKFFLTSKNLKTLDISHLRLQNLPNDVFKWNLSIESLDISHNIFSVVPTEALSQLGESLRTFKMSGNRIKILQSGSFYGLQNLRFIQMEQLLQLHTIEAYAFSSLENLENIELRYLPKLLIFEEKAFNLEESMDNDTVSYCPIYDFTLCFSTLPYLPPNLISWENTRQIMLRNNQWNCNCSMKWIKNSAVENITGYSMYCTYPYSVKGKTVIDLDENDFICTISSPVVNGGGGIAILAIFFVIGLLISTSTVMILVYRRNGWIIKRPGGFNLLENEIITVFDRTDQLPTISKPYQSTVVRDS